MMFRSFWKRSWPATPAHSSLPLALCASMVLSACSESGTPLPPITVGGGGGGGAPDAEDEDFEFMLRVMKMIQQEQDLRARTRVLEQLRRDVDNQPEEPAEP